MEKICLEIDQVILNAFKNVGLKAYGLCELVTKSKQQHPVTISGKHRTQASIDDRFQGVFYHRLLSANPSEDEDMSFGIDIQDRVSARLRTVLAFKIELSEEFIFDFIKSIPKNIKMEGFKFIQRSSSVDLIADHEAVYNQEYGQTTPYEHHRINWNIYAIEYSIEFILC